MMRRDGSSIQLALLVMLGILALPASTLRGQDDSFDAQLENLRRQDVAQVGRDFLVGAYDKLIRAHPQDPRTAEAMFEVAALFTSFEIPELRIHPDQAKALAWLRKATVTAATGSSTWINAQFALAGHVRAADTKEARRIVADIAARAKDKSSLLAARIEQELQSICIEERDLDGAEYHCRRLLGWYDDPERIPKLELEKAEIDYIIIGAGAFMVTQLQQAPWPVQKRRDRIVRLMDDYAGLAALWRDGTEALQRIREEAESETSPRETSNKDASEPPYPSSPVIAKLTWDEAVVKCGRDGSGDNWPIAWVEDDLCITAWGDGPGFDGPTSRDARLSLGLARIYGDPPGVRGEDFATSVDTREGGGSSGIKASGLLMVDGTLYMFVRNYKPPGSDDFTKARLAWSRDRGVHWEWADWYFADTFGCPEFVQFGKDYGGARDNYVYIASQANDSAYGFAPDIVMARVSKERVADRNSYEFFAGRDENSRPQWSADIGQRAPIFHDPHGTQRIAITYNAPLKRYILTTSHLPPGVKATHTAALGVFDAPEPWGPWTTVYYEDHWSVVNGKDCRTYHHKFPPKWMSPDGREMWLLYSGLDGGLYAFCLKKARLELRVREKDDTGAGLAAKYAGDKGIGSDPAVVFAEDFEEGSLDAVWKRWESIENKGIMSLSPDIPPGSGGAQSLLMSHVGGQSNGGHLYRRLLPGYDKLYMRFYVKFDPDCAPIHHFVHVGGYNPPTPWPQGGAGSRPAGNERFTTGVEPFGTAWRWDFYSYWMGMRSSPDGKSWGHDFINDPALKAERGRWTCVELMMKMNDPVTQSNGEQALWIDGRPWQKDGQVISHLGPGFPRGKWTWDSFHPDPKGTPFEGFQWRSSEDLKLNFLWLLLYITKAPSGHVSKVWFDDLIVAREYIGPLRPAGGSSKHQIPNPKQIQNSKHQ